MEVGRKAGRFWAGLLLRDANYNFSVGGFTCFKQGLLLGPSWLTTLAGSKFSLLFH